jgi:hypothetical protein
MEVIMDGFWIVLSGQGGELDRFFVKTEEQIGPELAVKLANDWVVIGVGDTIKIEEGWSEQ